MEKVDFKTKYTNPPKSDYEYYEEDTSLTVPDQVEPLQVIINKCLRGELIKVKDTYYENDGLDEKSAFDTLDKTSSPGFDLADIPSLVSEATQVAEGGKATAEPSSVGEEQTATDSKTESAESSD